MPRRRATVQLANSTPSTKEVEVETSIPLIESEIEIADEAVVEEPEPPVEMPLEAPVKASRKVSTPVGPVDTKEAPRPVAGQEPAPDGLILEQHEPLRIEGNDMGQSVVVTRDVYRKTYPMNSRRPSYILLYPRGSMVLKSQLVSIPKD